MNSIGFGWRWDVSYPLPMVLFAAFWLVNAPAYTAASPVLRPNPVAEQWVVKQVAANKIADLIERFPKEADRVLSAAFLVKLLTDSPQTMKGSRHGIRIQHAILTELLDLANGEILHETWLDDCRFERGVNFVSSHFHSKLSFNGSTFNAEETANFNSMKVDAAAFFNKAVFAGPVDFGYVTVASNFEADEAQFANAEQTANFNGMHVGHIAFFRHAVFAGPVDFRRVTVAGQFVADEAQFTNPEQTANFNSMKVDAAFFRHAVFAGPVDFGSVTVASNFEAHEAQFTNPKQTAIFNSMHVGHIAFFHHAVFAGPVDFRLVTVASNFEAHEAQFTNPEQTANFNSMKVDAAFFHHAVFAGPVDFSFATVARAFEANEAQFTNPEQTANFNSMKVDAAFFQHAVFAGPVSMADANFRALSIEGAKETASSWPSLDVSRTVITRELRITHVALQDLLAPALRVENYASLSGFTIQRRADLQYSSFATLVLSDVSGFMAKETTVLLDGMTYQQLHIGAGGGKALLTEQKWKDLLALVEKADYSAAVYLTLETFFHQQGYAEPADAVFVAQKRRERREVLGGPSHAAWWKNIVLDVVAGHGRHPSWAVLWSMLVVGIGYWVFHSRNNMDPYKPEDAVRPYNAFWYSLDLFAPVINLEAANVWRPKDAYRWRVRYKRVQKILGWLLVPLGVAAWTGILK